MSEGETIHLEVTDKEENQLLLLKGRVMNINSKTELNVRIHMKLNDNRDESSKDLILRLQK